MDVIDHRSLIQTGLIFLFFLFCFSILSVAAGWPNSKNGWPIVILVSAIVAFFPVAPRYLSLIGRNLSSFEAFGVKINFAAAAVESRVAESSVLLVQNASASPESGLGQLEEAAQQASAEAVFVIDLKQGREWYWTRLFALAGMAVLVGRPKFIVIVGQKGGRPQQVVGSIQPGSVLTALEQHDERYRKAWSRAKSELREAGEPTNRYNIAYQEVGDIVVMRILIDCLRGTLDPNITPLETTPPTPSMWITVGEAEKILGPWLVTSTVDLDKSNAERLDAALSSPIDIIVATRAGDYDGLIDVPLLERQVLRQLLLQKRA